jgi:hypothetical protein
LDSLKLRETFVGGQAEILLSETAARFQTPIEGAEEDERISVVMRLDLKELSVHVNWGGRGGSWAK